MDSRELFNLMTVFAVGAITVNLVLGLIRWSKSGEVQKCLTILVFSAFLAESCSYLLRQQNQSTYAVFHIYAVIEYILLALIFIRAFRDTKLSGILKISIPLFVCYALLNALFWQPLSAPNTNVVIVSGLIFITMSTLFLFRTLDKMVYQHIEKSALFWISVSVLVYFASTIIMFAFLTKLIPVDMKITGGVLVLNAVFNVIHYLGFSIALWMKQE